MVVNSFKCLNTFTNGFEKMSSHNMVTRIDNGFNNIKRGWGVKEENVVRYIDGICEMDFNSKDIFIGGEDGDDFIVYWVGVWKYQ